MNLIIGVVHEQTLDDGRQRVGKRVRFDITRNSIHLVPEVDRRLAKTRPLVENLVSRRSANSVCKLRLVIFSEIKSETRERERQ